MWRTNPRGFFASRGLDLDPAITELRPMQQDAIEWALGRHERFLLINAPTGSGKTLILGILGELLGAPWTYMVGTIRLQEQVARTFAKLPVLKGRGNFPCWLAEELGRSDITAAEGICVLDEWCEYMGTPDASYEDSTKRMCPYYEQKTRAVALPYRCTNYPMALNYWPLRSGIRGRPLTLTALCDEAHNIEEAVCQNANIYISHRTAGRFGLVVPHHTDIERWSDWALHGLTLLPKQQTGHPDFGLRTFETALRDIATNLDPGNWIIDFEDRGVKFRPIWGAGLVVPHLFGPIPKVVMTSATLMGAEFYADSLGLPRDDWAYLDLPSVFPPDIRPINYAPVVRMNAAAMQPGPNDTRAKMQSVIDRLIDWYIGRGINYGLIHAVSKKYMSYILTESRWSFIMTTDTEEHERRVRDGDASVLVSASLGEGWDGKDELCRFILMPKVPFPDLGDRRTKIRQEEDSRSYEHKALVAVVQGAGRGVRHNADWAETWILDESWRFLYAKRQGWLPRSFLDAYHHNVRCP